MDAVPGSSSGGRRPWRCRRRGRRTRGGGRRAGRTRGSGSTSTAALGRHAALEAEANRELWIAFLLDRGAAKSTSWWRSFERRFERCAAADPYYAAGDTPCAMVTSFTFCFQ